MTLPQSTILIIKYLTTNVQGEALLFPENVISVTMAMMIVYKEERQKTKKVSMIEALSLLSLPNITKIVGVGTIAISTEGGLRLRDIKSLGQIPAAVFYLRCVWVQSPGS